MLQNLIDRASTAGTGARVLLGSGIVRPYSPVVLAPLLRTVRT